VTRFLKQARFLSGILALVVGLTLVAPPAFAAEALAAVPAQPLAAAAAAKVNAMPAAALAQAAQAMPATATAETSTPFFKTTKGVVSLVLMAGATAWLVQSRINNKVSSPGRQ